MAELPDVLTRKYGPLPGGVWLAAIGGGLAYGAYRRRRAAPAGDSTDPAALLAQPNPFTTNPGAGNLFGSTGGNQAVTNGQPLGNQDPGPSLADILAGLQPDQPAPTLADILGMLPPITVTIPAPVYPETPWMPAPPPPQAAPPVFVQPPAAPVYVEPAAAPAPAPYVVPYVAPPYVAAAAAAVGGGTPLPTRTNVGGVRAYTSFDRDSQRRLRAGETVVAGDGRVFKNVIGQDGTPHATSIGMYNEVI